jgi:adenylate cyclase
VDLNRITEPTDLTVVLALADVTGFALACRNRTDLETFRLLDRLYEMAGAAAEAAGGKLVKPMGDAVLMVFPVEQARPAVAALQDLKQKADACWFEICPGSRLQIKAHAGPVTCGLMGAAGDKRFDVIGRTVNDLFLRPREEFAVSPALRQLLERTTGTT